MVTCTFYFVFLPQDAPGDVFNWSVKWDEGKVEREKAEGEKKKTLAGLFVSPEGEPERLIRIVSKIARRGVNNRADCVEILISR